MNPSRKSGNYWKRREKKPERHWTRGGISRIPVLQKTVNNPDKLLNHKKEYCVLFKKGTGKREVIVYFSAG
jgi:hypothetical protein